MSFGYFDDRTHRAESFAVLDLFRNPADRAACLSILQFGQTGGAPES
jgi:hypothetical protein